MKRALVTGATGFVGSRLTRRLIADGWTVHAAVRETSVLQHLQPVLSQIHVARIPNDQNLEDILRQANPDVVFHLASKFVAEHSPDQVSDLIDSNVRFGTKLLDAMAQLGKTLLVNAGTSWQHFESSTYRPVCLYAATKQAFDSILDFYVDAYDIRTITLMLFDTYGPADPRAKLFAALRNARTSTSPVGFSGGEQLIDLVYIDDVVEAFVLAAERLLNGIGDEKESFAVSSTRPMALKDIAEIYASVLGSRLNIAWGARPYRAREVMRTWTDGRLLPGWRPLVSLREGIIRAETAHE